MDRDNITRTIWNPQTRSEQDAIREELHRILSSSHFCNSKRYPALLHYVVESTLNGRSDHLKERTLGVEVFDRPSSYDTNTDTVVRYTAGEVRKRLSLYYSEQGHNSAIQISLPVGSYVPEFFLNQSNTPEETLPLEQHTPFAPKQNYSAETLHDLHAEGVHQHHYSRNKRFIWLGIANAFLILLIFCLFMRSYLLPPKTAVDVFWHPIVQNQSTVLLCTGSNTFSSNSFSGVATADKSVDYPFVSLQTAVAISRVTGILEHSRVAAQLVSAPTTQLTEMRERTVVLIGGHNNQWTMRLTDPLRFHFSEETEDAILDKQSPDKKWARDHSLPYSKSSDYALIARFRDTNTGSWILVLAGLGRNGTEAAAQFATDPHYMQQLQDRIGKNFENKNIEVIMQVSVIDGKTGAPSILDVHTW